MLEEMIRSGLLVIVTEGRGACASLREKIVLSEPGVAALWMGVGVGSPAGLSFTIWRRLGVRLDD